MAFSAYVFVRISNLVSTTYRPKRHHKYLGYLQEKIH